MRTLSHILPLTVVSVLMAMLPLFAFAQTNAGNLTGVTTFIQNIIRFMNGTLVPLIFAIAFLVFLWGMFKTFILGGSDEDKQKEGKQLMMYSIAGFVIMVSLWGIVNLVAQGFGFTTTGQGIQNIPNLPTTRP